MATPTLTIITRIGGGRRQVIAEAPASFGRAADNALVVGGQFTSRNHGQLTVEDDQWFIHNESPNGTQVNGKKVGRKPRALRDRDVISICDEVVFEVRIGEVAGAGTAEETATAFDDDAPAPAKAGMTRRTKLWIGVGIYMVLFCGLFVFLLTLRDRTQTHRTHLTPLTRQQIAEEIRANVPVLERDERQYNEAVETAQELANRLESSPDAMYRAYMAYSRALAMSGRRDFTDGLAQRQYIDIRDRLINRVTETYLQGYEHLRGNQFRIAIRDFQRVRDIYPDHTSNIHRNATLQRKAASDEYAKQRRRK